MNFRCLIMIVVLALAACSHAPRTDAELEARAHEAVDHKFGQQAAFSEEEVSIVHNIACGHAMAPQTGASTPNGRDFVYENDKLIMDSDPGFDDAATRCDAAEEAVTASPTPSNAQ
jgi:hypothetical protein